MTPELRERLFERFPTLYRQPALFDFGAPDGWFDILWRLSEKLEPLVEATSIQVLQVKSKFGALRYYWRGKPSAEVTEAIRAAEAECDQACEFCGKAAKHVCTASRASITACEEHRPPGSVEDSE